MIVLPVYPAAKIGILTCARCKGTGYVRWFRDMERDGLKLVADFSIPYFWIGALNDMLEELVDRASPIPFNSYVEPCRCGSYN